MTFTLFSLSFAVFYLLGWLFACFFSPVVIRFVSDHNCRPNFQKKELPCGSGLLLLATVLAVAPVQAIWLTGLGYSWSVMSSYWLGFSLASLAGWMDDAWGDQLDKGMAGHLKRLIVFKRLSTGSVKVFLLGTAGLLAVWPLAQSWWEWALGGMVAAAAANGVNLLDTRPGRAIKFFFLALFSLALSLSIVSGGNHLAAYMLLISSLLAATAILLRLDLRLTSMMGDSGANPLGFVLGLGSVIAWPPRGEAFLLMALLLLHVAGERYSLGQLIEQIPPMSWLDRWGRSGS